MSDLRIYILTEGGEKIGYGHIGRCTSLYQAFEELGFQPLFIVDGTQQNEPIWENINVLFFNWKSDIERLTKEISEAHIVIIDSYKADLTVYELIARISHLTLYLDDDNRLNYPNGVLLNGTVGVENYAYCSNNLSYLLGNKYILLRKSFWNIPTKHSKENASEIFINFGGSDIRALTPKVLEIVNRDYPHWIKHIILSRYNPIFEEAYSLKDNNTNFYSDLSAEQMAELMTKCDIAISAAGQTLNELARCGLPTIAFQIIENQTGNIEGWTQIGFIDRHLHYSNWNSTELITAIRDLIPLEKRQKISSIGQASVDGKGALRVVSELLAESIKLNRATDLDLYDLFELANDPIIRANSFSTAAIQLEEHTNWFNRVLLNDNQLLLTARIHQLLLGQVRFDKKENETIISISISSRFRGCGLGSSLLDKSLQFLKEYWNDTTEITAFVKSSNIASQRIFEKTGFVKYSSDEQTYKYIFHYV